MPKFLKILLIFQINDNFLMYDLCLNKVNWFFYAMVGIDQVLEKLSTVIDPDLKKDIVSMGMIKNLELNDGNLKFTLELTTPACPFNIEIEDDVRKAIGEISELKNFDMNVTAKVMEGRSLDDDTGMATVKNIIGVASGKGGVGKSTVSLNLALALSQAGAKVGLLDADIYGPSIPLMLGMKDAFMEVEENKLQPAESNGLKVVSFGSLQNNHIKQQFIVVQLFLEF